MAEDNRARRTFRKFSFRGIDLEQLVDYTVSKRYDELMGLLCARQRRRFGRGLSRKHSALLKKLKKARANCDETGRPETVRTHLRDMIIVPEMIGSVVGVYNGKDFVLLEVKASMIGHYLGEFAISYKPVTHGRPGIGASGSSKFVPLK